MTNAIAAKSMVAREPAARKAEDKCRCKVMLPLGAHTEQLTVNLLNYTTRYSVYDPYKLCIVLTILYTNQTSQ